jgi:hypothetical protein
VVEDEEEAMSIVFVSLELEIILAVLASEEDGTNESLPGRSVSSLKRAKDEVRDGKAEVDLDKDKDAPALSGRVRAIANQPDTPSAKRDRFLAAAKDIDAAE